MTTLKRRVEKDAPEKSEDDKETIQDILNTLTEKQKDAVAISSIPSSIPTMALLKNPIRIPTSNTIPKWKRRKTK